VFAGIQDGSTFRKFDVGPDWANELEAWTIAAVGSWYRHRRTAFQADVARDDGATHVAPICRHARFREVT
jgi:hypothetical protein